MLLLVSGCVDRGLALAGQQPHCTESEELEGLQERLGRGAKLLGERGKVRMARHDETGLQRAAIGDHVTGLGGVRQIDASRREKPFGMPEPRRFVRLVPFHPVLPVGLEFLFQLGMAAPQHALHHAVGDRLRHGRDQGSGRRVEADALLAGGPLDRRADLEKGIQPLLEDTRLASPEGIEQRDFG